MRPLYEMTNTLLKRINILPLFLDLYCCSPHRIMAFKSSDSLAWNNKLETNYEHDHHIIANFTFVKSSHENKWYSPGFLTSFLKLVKGNLVKNLMQYIMWYNIGLVPRTMRRKHCNAKYDMCAIWQPKYLSTIWALER